MSKPRSKDMNLDPGTFGGTPACHVLVDMMNRGIISISEKHKVLSFIANATLQFKWISVIPNVGVKTHTMYLMRNELLDRIDKMPYPAKFNSYLKNVIMHYFRRYLKEAAWTIAP